MPCWVTKANFARQQQVPANTVSRWVRIPDGPLVDALDPRGDKIDVDHPCVRRFLESQERKADRRTIASRRAAEEGEDDGIPDGLPGGASPSFADSELMQHLTVAEVATRFGGLPMFTEYVKTYNVLQDARKKELANLKTDGTLVSRDLVRAAVLTHIDRLHRRLLTDFAETITRLIYGHCNAGDAVEVAKLTVRDRIGHVLGESIERTIKGFTELNQDGIANDDPDSATLESGDSVDEEPS